MKEYSAKSITPHSWPALEQLADGTTRRQFQIQLTTAPDTVDTRVDLEELSARIYHSIRDLMPHLEAEDIRVSLEAKKPAVNQMVASLTTKIDGQRDEALIAAWHMFEEIDRTIGPIHSIEGYPRNHFPPWVLRKGDLEEV